METDKKNVILLLPYDGISSWIKLFVDKNKFNAWSPINILCFQQLPTTIQLFVLSKLVQCYAMIFWHSTNDSFLFRLFLNAIESQ